MGRGTYLLHKFGDLRSIPATYVKVEEENQLHKLSSDLHAVAYEPTITNKIYKIMSIGVWVYVGLCRSQRHKIAFEAGVPGVVSQLMWVLRIELKPLQKQQHSQLLSHLSITN